MRWIVVLAAFLLASGSVLGQSDFRPDAIIVVTEHSTGADDVQISMRAADYPRSLFETQLKKLGELVGTPPRGVLVTERLIMPEDPSSRALKATFAIDGIIDRPGGKLNIEPVLKAFAGAPDPHTVKGISIIFEGETPTSKTVRKFGKEDVVSAIAKGSIAPPGIEYSIALLTQDPKLIEFPSQTVNEPQNKKEAPVNGNSNQTAIYVLLILAAISGGALVYLALLRPGRRST